MSLNKLKTMDKITNAGLKVLLLLFILIVSGIFAIACISEGKIMSGVGSGLIALTSIFLAIRITFKDMDQRALTYDINAKELITFKGEIEKAITKETLKPLVDRLGEYQVKFKNDPYFMYLLDFCQGMVKGKLSILENISE